MVINRLYIYILASGASQLQRHVQLMKRCPLCRLAGGESFSSESSRVLHNTVGLRNTIWGECMSDLSIGMYRWKSAVDDMNLEVNYVVRGVKTYYGIGVRWRRLSPTPIQSQFLNRLLLRPQICLLLSDERELNRRSMYEYRCDESLKVKDEGSTRLVYTGWRGGLEHFQGRDEVKPRLIR